MKQLFWIECKKIGKSIVFWFFVLALCLTYFLNYGTIAEDEIGRSADPESVFYMASDGQYAANQEDILSNESAQNKMMMSATNRLLDCYRRNSYEYYPFGYIKEKVMSAEEQETILMYLKELTGLNEQVLDGTKEESGEDDIQVSGGGAYVLAPNKGEMNENGQFIAQPEDWEYVENGTISGSAEGTEDREQSFEIQVSFARFKEIMDSIDGMIGKNSYFSWTLLNLYYGENDMEDAPITLIQHKEFYEKDHVTGAFARYYCDSIALVILWLPAFIIIGLMLKDKHCKMRELTFQRTISSRKLIGIRFVAAVFMTIIPIFLLPLKSAITLMQYGSKMGIQTDVFAFAKYICGWILPTVLFVTAIALFITTLTENYFSVLVTGIIWLVGRPSIAKLGGGNYGLFDLVIRHNTLKGYGRMAENLQALVLNRVLITIAAILLVILSVFVYEAKRKGGLSFGREKFSNHFRHKYSSEH